MHTAFRLVPVVFELYQEAIINHLLRLPLPDRYLRFCHAADDETIRRYVENIDADRDAVCIVVSEHDQSVVGMMHVAVEADDAVEFALSVDVEYRRRGVGSALFDRGLMFCRAKGIKRIYMNCLSTNTAIKRMAVQRGMTITSDYGESVAKLDVSDKNAVLAWLEAAQNDTLALYDASCRHTYHQWLAFIDSVRNLSKRDI